DKPSHAALRCLAAVASRREHRYPAYRGSSLCVGFCLLVAARAILPHQPKIQGGLRRGAQGDAGTSASPAAGRGAGGRAGPLQRHAIPFGSGSKRHCTQTCRAHQYCQLHGGADRPRGGSDYLHRARTDGADDEEARGQRRRDDEDHADHAEEATRRGRADGSAQRRGARRPVYIVATTLTFARDEDGFL
ncbi:hypothetical protein AAVH_42758, partial [Aphelenchoides avenae]